MLGLSGLRLAPKHHHGCMKAPQTLADQKQATFPPKRYSCTAVGLLIQMNMSGVDGENPEGVGLVIWMDVEFADLAWQSWQAM